MNQSVFYAGLMLLAGLGIPVMAALNGGLGARLHSPALAAVILFAVGLLVAVCYLIATQGIPAAIPLTGTPGYLYLGGFFVMFYILTITWVAPRFGVANAVAFVLLGQLVAMTAIDHFGLFGATHFAFTPRRLIGLVFMAAGIALVVARPAN